MSEVRTEEATIPQFSPAPENSFRKAPAPPVVGAAVAGPFTLRDLLVIGCSIAILLVSLIPSQNSRGTRWFMMWSDINWISGFVYVGAVVAVGALFFIRRVAPRVYWAQRIGSFSTDQLASVVAVYSAIDWFSKMVALAYRYVSRFGTGDSNIAIALLGFSLAVFYVVITVGAPNIPRLRDDFDLRPEEGAHRVARTIAPAVRLPRPKPRTESSGPNAAGPPASNASLPFSASGDGFGPATTYRQADEPVMAPEYKPFWFAVVREAEVIDEQSRQPFILKPGVWYLALKDLGSEFLVTDRNSLSQEKNPMKRGILKDIEGVERA